MKVILDGYVIDLTLIYSISPIEFEHEWSGYRFKVMFLNKKSMRVDVGVGLKEDSLEKLKALTDITNLRNNLIKVWDNNRTSLFEITSK